EQDRDEGEDSSQRQVPQHGENESFNNEVALEVEVLFHEPRLLEHLLVDPRTTEHGEPDESHDRGHEEHPADELADRAATGDPGDEHPDEWGPGDPPTPVEDRPSGEPARGPLTPLEGPDVEGHLEELAEVDPEGFHEVLEQEHGGAEQQHGDEQQPREGEVDVREPLDPRPHAADDRERGEEGDHGDEDDQEE